MKRTLVSLLLVLMLPLAAVAQDSAPAGTSLKHERTYRINLLSPSLGIEYGLSSKFSLYGEAGFMVSPIELQEFNDLAVMPKVRFDLRYYYNLSSRLAAGKQTQNFSGSYFAFTAVYIYRAANANLNGRNQYLPLALVWGLQRKIGKWGFMDFQAGAGMVWHYEDPAVPGDSYVIRPAVTREWGFSPTLRLGIGFQK